MDSQLTILSYQLMMCVNVTTNVKYRFKVL